VDVENGPDASRQTNHSLSLMASPSLRAQLG
jgi:hypothetical protein